MTLEERKDVWDDKITYLVNKANTKFPSSVRVNERINGITIFIDKPRTIEKACNRIEHTINELIIEGYDRADICNVLDILSKYYPKITQ